MLEKNWEENVKCFKKKREEFGGGGEFEFLAKIYSSSLVEGSRPFSVVTVPFESLVAIPSITFPDGIEFSLIVTKKIEPPSFGRSMAETKTNNNIIDVI